MKVAIHVEKLAAKVKKMRGNRTAAARPSDNSASAGDAEDVSAMEDELGVAAEVEAEEDTFVNNIIQKRLLAAICWECTVLLLSECLWAPRKSSRTTNS